MILTQCEWWRHDGISLLHEVVELEVQGIKAQLPGGMLHDGLHHPRPINHAGGPDCRVGMGVSPDTERDEPTVGDLVAALTKHCRKDGINLIQTPAGVTVKVAVNSLDFSIS